MCFVVILFSSPIYRNNDFGKVLEGLPSHLSLPSPHVYGRKRLKTSIFLIRDLLI